MTRTIDPTRAAEVARLWNDEGLSVSAIAERLGLTKGTMAGIMYRLRGRNLVVTRTGSPPVAEVQLPAPEGHEAAPSAPDEPVASDTDDDEPTPTPLDTLHRAATAMSNGCKWPMWGHQDKPDHRYCGKVRANPLVSYCAEHMGVAYQKRVVVVERERPVVMQVPA